MEKADNKEKTIHFEPPNEMDRMYTAPPMKHSCQNIEPEPGQASV